MVDGGGSGLDRLMLGDAVQGVFQKREERMEPPSFRKSCATGLGGMPHGPESGRPSLSQYSHDGHERIIRVPKLLNINNTFEDRLVVMDDLTQARVSTIRKFLERKRGRAAWIE